MEALCDEAGVTSKPGETIENVTYKAVQRGEGQILSFECQGDTRGSDLKKAKLETLREQLLGSLQSYRQIQEKDHSVSLSTSAPVSSENLVSAAASVADTTANNSQSGDPQEEALWKELGSVIQVTPKYRADAESLQAKIFNQYKKDYSDLTAEESKLKELEKQAQSLSQKVTTSEDKTNSEKQLKNIQAQINVIAQKKQALHQYFTKSATLVDAIVRHQTARDLGVKYKKPETAKKVSTLLGAQSVGDSMVEAQTSAPVQSSQGEEDHQTSSFVGTNTAPLATATDFTGTLLSIASTGSQAQEEAKQTDKQIKELLQAALAGNWEAVKTAMIFLDKKASTIVIGIGAQTIKSMQSYEQSMTATSNAIGALKSGDPAYSSKLAKFNSDMNMYSLNRQAISNFLRDTLTMREEIANVTHSILQRDAQIIASTSHG